jgi:hypothetical protein
MSRNEDRAPVPHTCPIIDEVISALLSAEFSEGDYWDSKRAIEIMENIRIANSKLREWGNEECQRANDIDGELWDANKEIKALKQDLE